MKFRKQLLLYLFLLFGGVLMIIMKQLFRKEEPKVYMPRDYNEIMNSGEMNVVTDYNSIGYYVSGDSAIGFQLDLLRALEEDWNLKVNLFLENSLEENLLGLKEQRYDLVARSIPVNSVLRDSFAFTEPITHNRLVLVQRKALFNNGKEPIRQHLNLAGEEIYVTTNSPAIVRLNNLSHEIADTIIIREEPLYETEQLVIMVAAGDIDFTVCDQQIAENLARSLPEIDINTDISFTQLESWALRHDSPVLLDSLNNWMIQFRETVRFRKIYRSYYHN